MRALVVALALFAIGEGALAFNYAEAPGRSATASVVASSSAYDGVTTVQIDVPLTGGSNRLGARVVNQGSPLAQTITWTETSDPNNVATPAAACSAPTAVGATCEVRFNIAPSVTLGTFTFTGKVDASAAGYRSTVPGVVVTVRYCTLC